MTPDIGRRTLDNGHRTAKKAKIIYPPPRGVDIIPALLINNRLVASTGKVYNLFIYLGFYVAFNTVQVISRRVVGRAEETSTYSSLGFCTVNCRPTTSNYQLSHLRPCRESNPGLRGGRRECYHSATVAPGKVYKEKSLASSCNR